MSPIARKEIRDAIRSRWVVGYVVLLALLGGLASLAATRTSFGMALQSYGRTTATLTNLCLLLAPLIALTMGGLSIAGERDRGTLDFLLAQPISRRELFFGKYIGLLSVLAGATFLGFAPAGIVLGITTGPAVLVHYLVFPALSTLLIAAMLGLGMLISVRSRTGAQAQGTAILLWFLFVLLYDLLLLGSVVAGSLNGTALAVLLVCNPVDATRVLAILAFEPDLYLLGPAGALITAALSRSGAALTLLAVLIGWSTVPLWLAWRAFRLKLPQTGSGSQHVRRRRGTLGIHERAKPEAPRSALATTTLED